MRPFATIPADALLVLLNEVEAQREMLVREIMERADVPLMLRALRIRDRHRLDRTDATRRPTAKRSCAPTSSNCGATASGASTAT